MQASLKELIKAALSNPSFSFSNAEFIKSELNAIKDFYDKASKTDTSPEKF